MAEIQAIGRVRLRIIGLKLDENPRSKEWITKARKNTVSKLNSMATGGPPSLANRSRSFALTEGGRQRFDDALRRCGAWGSQGAMHGCARASGVMAQIIMGLPDRNFVPSELEKLKQLIA